MLFSLRYLYAPLANLLWIENIGVRMPLNEFDWNASQAILAPPTIAFMNEAIAYNQMTIEYSCFALYS